MRSLIGPALGFALVVMAGVVWAAPADIDADRLREHVRYLASEELQGRLTGTRGEELATAYVADQFESWALNRPATTAPGSRASTSPPASRSGGATG
jgi:hypothetical protein